MSSRRLERVASLLKQAIGRVIVSDLKDPRMGFVTVVRVAPSPDLRTAEVFVSVLGEGTEISRPLHGLRHAAKFIKHRVSDEIEMRMVPNLVFVEDKTVKGAARVSKLIDDALAESAAVAKAKQGDIPGVPPDAPPAAPPAEGEEEGPAVEVSDEEFEELLEEKKDEEDLEDDEEAAKPLGKPKKAGKKKAAPVEEEDDEEEADDEEEDDEEEDGDEVDDDVVDDDEDEDEDEEEEP